MALPTIFGNMLIELRKLSDAFDVLRVSLGDKPPDESALVDGLEEQVVTICGALEECRAAALRSRQAGDPALHFDRARKELTSLQRQFEQVSRLYAEMASFEKLKELEQLAKHRRGEWRPWAGAVLRGLEESRPALEKAGSALAQCWQELEDHAGTALGAVGEQPKLKRKKR